MPYSFTPCRGQWQHGEQFHSICRQTFCNLQACDGLCDSMRSLAKARRPRAPNMYKFTSFSLGGTPTLSPDPWFKTCLLHNLDRSHTSPVFVPEPVRMPLPSPGHRSSRNALTLEVGLATRKASGLKMLGAQRFSLVALVAFSLAGP